MRGVAISLLSGLSMLGACGPGAHSPDDAGSDASDRCSVEPLHIEPSSLDLGEVAVGTTLVGGLAVEVTNTCLIPVWIETSLTGPDAVEFRHASTCDGAPLAGGTTCIELVRLEPTRTGAASAQLELTWSRSPDLAGHHHVSLSGTGVAP